MRWDERRGESEMTILKQNIHRSDSKMCIVQYMDMHLFLTSLILSRISLLPPPRPERLVVMVTLVGGMAPVLLVVNCDVQSLKLRVRKSSLLCTVLPRLSPTLRFGYLYSTESSLYAHGFHFKPPGAACPDPTHSLHLSSLVALCTIAFKTLSWAVLG